MGYHPFSCSKALHKAGPQSVNTESGHQVPSFIQGFKTPRGRHGRHPRILLLSSAMHTECRQCPLGHSWEGMFMPQLPSIAELCAGW